jgi:hypothetical protein
LNEEEATIGASVVKQNATTTERSAWLHLRENLVISPLPAKDYLLVADVVYAIGSICPHGHRTRHYATGQSHGDKADENGTKELRIGHMGLPIRAKSFLDFGEAYGDRRRRTIIRR